MLDVQVLPTAALGIPNLPTALAELSLGEQVGRAYAPSGGVQCGTTTVPNPVQPASNPPKPLAYTGSAYEIVPMFWLGTAMLLAGSIIVAALPRRTHPRYRAVSIASTAMLGLTFSSMACRHASTASSRRSVDSCDQFAAADRMSSSWSGW